MPFHGRRMMIWKINDIAGRIFPLIWLLITLYSLFALEKKLAYSSEPFLFLPFLPSVDPFSLQNKANENNANLKLPDFASQNEKGGWDYLGTCSVIETFKRTKANCVRFPRTRRLHCVFKLSLMYIYAVSKNNFVHNSSDLYLWKKTTFREHVVKRTTVVNVLLSLLSNSHVFLLLT